MENCCCITPFVVSASVEKPGEAVALLPVQHLESSQGNGALLKGVRVFSVKRVQTINGWEPQSGVLCAGLGGAFCHPKPLLVLEVVGFVWWLSWLCCVQLYLGVVSPRVRLSEHLAQVNKLGRDPELGVWFLRRI